MEQDVVWVNGGSVVNLLAVWRAHGLDAIFPRVWAGRRRAGRGQCRVDLLVPRWHDGLVPAPARPGDQRPGAIAVRQWCALRLGGPAPPARARARRRRHARRDPLHRRRGRAASTAGTELVEAVTERAGKGAYVVRRDGDQAVEERWSPGCSLRRSPTTPRLAGARPGSDLQARPVWSRLLGVRELARPPDPPADVVGQRRHEQRPDDERVHQHAEGDREADLGQEHDRQHAQHGEGRREHDAGRRDDPAGHRKAHAAHRIWCRTAASPRAPGSSGRCCSRSRARPGR